MPQLDFKFLRDTPNYRCFIAEDPDGSGIPYHLYLPSHALTPVKEFLGIVSRHRSEIPGVYANGTVRHEPAPSSAVEIVNKEWLQRNTADIGNLQHDVKKLQIRQGILFRAVEKLIKMFVPRSKRPPLQQGEYDAVVRGTRFLGPKIVEVDLQILGPKK